MLPQAPQMPPPGWYPDPKGTGGRSYWTGQEWGAAKPPAGKRGLIITCVVLGAILLLTLIGNMGNDNTAKSTTTTTTVTKTVTVSAAPTTVTVEAQQSPPPTVTVTAAAPAPRLLETAPPEAPAYIPPVPAQSSSVYYPNCAAARAAGAAPLLVGQPGYRGGLDRDGDGVACE